MIALGVDPSTKTGIAIVDSVKGVLLRKEIKVPKGQKGLRRAVTISDVIVAVIREYKPDVIAIEGYGYGNAHTLATLVEVGTIIRLCLQVEADGYYEVPPTSLKKYVTGKGNCKKDLMLLEIYKRFGCETTNDNEADAIGLAYLALSMKRQGPELPKVNMSALDKLEFRESGF